MDIHGHNLVLQTIVELWSTKSIYYKPQLPIYLIIIIIYNYITQFALGFLVFFSIAKSNTTRSTVVSLATSSDDVSAATRGTSAWGATFNWRGNTQR